MKMFSRLILIITLMLTSICMSAQTKGDQLFQQGQTYQQTMTIKSQNAAIKKFQAAKIAYGNDDKKKICDNQINICKANIKQITEDSTNNNTKKDKTKDTKKKKIEEVKEDKVEEVKPQYHSDLTLSLSKSRLDFKAKPKEGSTQSVEVHCNYDGWFVAKKPDWVTIYVTTGKFTVEVEENTTGEDRSGVITIGCENKEADIVVNQTKLKGVKKLLDNVKKNIENM